MRYAMLLFFQTLDTSCLEFKKVILVKETIEHVVAFKIWLCYDELAKPLWKKDGAE